MRAAPSALVLVAFAMSMACGISAFSCAEPSDCETAGVGGVCQADGHCSFPDDECPSGQRYGEHSGGVAGECVPTVDNDTTAEDATADDTTSASTSSTSAGPTTLPLDATASTDVDPTADTSTGASSFTETGTNDTGDTGPPMLDPDLLVWLTLDELENDSAANDGVLGGDATCMASTCPESDIGMIDDAMAFDGIDDCLAFASTPELEAMTEFTIATWLRLEAPGDHYAFVVKPTGASFSNSFALYYYPGSIEPVEMFAVTDGTTGATLHNPRGLPIGAWAHVAGTFDGAMMQLWVDGQLVGSVMNTLLAFDEQPVLIGCDDDHDANGLAAHAFAGIDEVRVYARALTSDEIAELATGR